MMVQGWWLPSCLLGWLVGFCLAGCLFGHAALFLLDRLAKQGWGGGAGGGGDSLQECEWQI